MEHETNAAKIYCDMTHAPDTAHQRLGAYRELFEQALIAKERTLEGIRFRFRGDDGVEERVQGLAAREKQCCAFFTFGVCRAGGEVLWDATVVDDELARGVLDELYRLPETLDAGPGAAYERFTARGLHVQIDDGTGLRRATLDELGLADDT